MIGDELIYSPSLGLFEKLYIKIFGVPINGLRIRLRRVMPAIDGYPSKILDAGCGRAVFSYQLAKKFPDSLVTGVDLDIEQLNQNKYIASKVGFDNLSFRKMDVANLNDKNEFDLIISVDNLEHIEDDGAAIKHIAMALKTGGKLVLHVPAIERRWPLVTFRRNFDVPGHFRPGYALDQIINKVELEGLKILSSQYTFGFLENITNNISYFITKAEAKNKMLYALIFPMLNLVSWLGSKGKPSKGAGILIVAKK